MIATTYRVSAKREVIISAGVIGTPKLLQLSGIGNPDTLRSLKIEPLVSLPDVGQGMQDHPLVPMYFPVNSNQTFDQVFGNPAVFAALEAQWNASRIGILTDSPGNTQSFMRIPHDAPIFQNFSDPSAGANAAHLELIFVVSSIPAFGSVGRLTGIFKYSFAPLGAIPPQPGSFLSILAIVASPMASKFIHQSFRAPSNNDRSRGLSPTQDRQGI